MAAGACRCSKSLCSSGLAEEEAEAIKQFEIPEIGGFYFGRRNVTEYMPFHNPWSTGFCLQALAMWEGDRNIPVWALI